MCVRRIDTRKKHISSSSLLYIHSHSIRSIRLFPNSSITFFLSPVLREFPSQGAQYYRLYYYRVHIEFNVTLFLRSKDKFLQKGKKQNFFMFKKERQMKLFILITRYIHKHLICSQAHEMHCNLLLPRVFEDDFRYGRFRYLENFCSYTFCDIL